ncbi:MAG: PEP-CTERM sorting domain-containing protein [Candidatus Nealsonbacteria bacterium]|nr:PEP-CTERM sorting domain-containing protein [Candidatus Nealsonbacteria bacterium]
MKNTSCKHRVRAGLLAGIFLASISIAASPVRAEFIGLVTVTATNSHGSASANFNPLSHLPPQAQVPERVRLMLAEKFKMRSQGEVIGTIDELIIDMDGDPVVQLTFGATSGSSDTTFSITSTVVAFDPLSFPTAEATMNGTLTDTGNDGASLSSTSGLFQALYNGDTTFASLVGGVNGGAGSVTEFGQLLGPMEIDGDVDSIQGIVQFTLSADDTVSGVGRFEVTPQIPEPSTFVLLGIAAVGLLIRTRRRQR